MTDRHPKFDPAKTGPMARRAFFRDVVSDAIMGDPPTPKEQQASAMKRARQAHLLNDLQIDAERRGWSLRHIRGSLVLQRKGFRNRKFPSLHTAQVAVYKLKEHRQ